MKILGVPSTSLFTTGTAPLRAYLLTEALVYISVVLVVLGVGYVALYRSINNSLALRRSADDISRALSIGETWRADIRSAVNIHTEETAEGKIVVMEAAEKTNAWRVGSGTVFRRGDAGNWLPVLSRVKHCSIERDTRSRVNPWRMELELVPRSKSARIRPLFTFTAVEHSPLSK